MQAYQGVVLSAFFGGYAATQILGGRLADNYGGKLVLTTGVALWSLFTCVTPFAAAHGTASLLAARVLLGVGEGVAFPAIHSIIGKATSSLVFCASLQPYRLCTVLFIPSKIRVPPALSFVLCGGT